MPTTSFVFGLPPEKAIAFLQIKRSVVDKLDQAGMRESAMAKATVIANLTSLEMTKNIYDSLIEAQKQGKPFGQWQKELMQTLHKKGWIAGYSKKEGYLIADPSTGEIFGSPRRLETIYRTNMQAAYSAARYQQQMDNVDSRPYWQYSAINDNRTRPSHSAMNGVVYRYDDPFWATFYPPNGFNCRCSVIALAERDIERRGISVGQSGERLQETLRAKDRAGNQEKTTAYTLPSGQQVVADKGFDYTVGRISYRPNLDLYPEKLAHEFAKREMNGGEFAYTYKWLDEQITPHLSEYKALKNRDERDSYLKSLRNSNTREFKFAVGVFSQETRNILGTQLKTVWLSDDTLAKQIAHHSGQFPVSDYGLLPEVLFSPDDIKPSKDNRITFSKTINGKRYVAVLKILENTKEIFMLSFRRD